MIYISNDNHNNHNVQMDKQSIQNGVDKRKNRFQAIRVSLQQNPVLKANSSAIQNKIEKRRKRRESVQLDATLTQSQKNILLQQQYNSVKAMAKFYQKYTMGAKIGEGSDGFVKKCYLKSTNQVFAVKSIKMDEEHILFLKTNFKDIYELNHPNIIKYKNMYLDLKNKTSFLVMDYENHPNLLEYKDLSEDEIKLIAQQLLDTVAYIHSCNICHRDIKPDNILYDRENKMIKLVDFGISKNVQNRGNKRQMLTITGTLYYRAPQMFSGGGYDQNVDVWAVGITLYQLVTGKTPFQSEYLTQTIENIERGEICFDQNIWNRYTKPAKDLIIRLLKKRQQRFTAAEAKKHFWFNKKSSMSIDLSKSDSLNFKLGEQITYTAIKYLEDTDKFRTSTNIPQLKKNLKIKLHYDQSSDSDNLIQIQSEEEQVDSPSIQKSSEKGDESSKKMIDVVQQSPVSF